jgi:4-amino-4-deoxy-L-arabinose transferase-like glycosyltransferase
VAGRRKRSRRHAQLATIASTRRPDQFAAWLLIAFAVPRIIRIAYPEVWVEDDLYLQSAFNITAGLHPYIDFVHPQMPLLEWIAAAYIRLVGASHLTFEVANEAAIFATTVFVYKLGAKVFDRRVGTAGALLFAWHSLTFRYHVWAREFFVDACVLAACYEVIRGGLLSWRRTAWIGLLLGLAITIKLTAAIEAIALLGSMAVLTRHRSARSVRVPSRRW